MSTLDIALLIVRVWAGAVMLAHGVNHARSLDGTTRWFERIGFRPARAHALASAGGELAMGIGLVLGLATPLAAAGLAATMVIAFWSVHRFAGFFVFARPDEGYEYVVTLMVLSLSVALLGPGAISIDAVINAPWAWQGWAGALVYALGLLMAAVILAVSWRRPHSRDGG
jgi:putative oxidoreductase